MKAGDTVQVAHLDGAVHWIYATVITPNDDGSALVQIQHPGNFEHGAIKFMQKDKIKTKADLQAEIDALQKPNVFEFMDAYRKNLASLNVQLDRLS
jgi:hypothetical protein